MCDALTCMLPLSVFFSVQVLFMMYSLSIFLKQQVCGYYEQTFFRLMEILIYLYVCMYRTISCVYVVTKFHLRCFVMRNFPNVVIMNCTRRWWISCMWAGSSCILLQVQCIHLVLTPRVDAGLSSFACPIRVEVNGEIVVHDNLQLVCLPFWFWLYAAVDH